MSHSSLEATEKNHYFGELPKSAPCSLPKLLNFHLNPPSKSSRFASDDNPAKAVCKWYMESNSASSLLTSRSWLSSYITVWHRSSSFSPRSFLFLLISFLTRISIPSHFVLFWLSESDTSLSLFRLKKIWLHPCGLHRHPNKYRFVKFLLDEIHLSQNFFPVKQMRWKRSFRLKAEWFLVRRFFEAEVNESCLNHSVKSGFHSTNSFITYTPKGG